LLLLAAASLILVMLSAGVATDAKAGGVNQPDADVPVDTGSPTEPDPPDPPGAKAASNALAAPVGAGVSTTLSSSRDGIDSPGPTDPTPPPTTEQ